MIEIEKIKDIIDIYGKKQQILEKIQKYHNYQKFKENVDTSYINTADELLIYHLKKKRKNPYDKLYITDYLYIGKDNEMYCFIPIYNRKILEQTNYIKLIKSDNDRYIGIYKETLDIIDFISDELEVNNEYDYNLLINNERN